MPVPTPRTRTTTGGCWTNWPPQPPRSAPHASSATWPWPTPSGTVRAESEASCHGRIVLAPRGTHGFGYDPLFEIVEYHRTFGELSDLVKSCLSHRARAVRRLLPQLIGLQIKAKD